MACIGSEMEEDLTFSFRYILYTMQDEQTGYAYII